MGRRLHVTIAIVVGGVVAVGCAPTRDVASPTFEPRQAGLLTVAAALPAPGFWDGESPQQLRGGFEWALATELAERFDLRLEVRDVPFERLAAGQLGPADLALAQISITDERSELVDFSISYFDTSIGVLARAGEEIRDLRTAREQQWAVAAGTTEAAFLDETVRPDEPPVVVADEVAAAAAVVDGEADAALMDLPTALVLAAGDPRLATVGRFLDDQRYGIALPKGSPNRELVDATLRALMANGTLDELVETWLVPAFGMHPDDVPVIRAR